MREYHFTMTLRWTVDGQHTITASNSDVIMVGAKATRSHTFDRIFEKSKRALSAPDRCAIVFYVLEPNELAA